MLRKVDFERETAQGGKAYISAWVKDSKKLKPGVRVSFKEENDENWWQVVKLGNTAKKEEIRGIQRFKFPSTK